MGFRALIALGIGSWLAFSLAGCGASVDTGDNEEMGRVKPVDPSLDAAAGDDEEIITGGGGGGGQGGGGDAGSAVLTGGGGTLGGSVNTGTGGDTGGTGGDTGGTGGGTGDTGGSGGGGGTVSLTCYGPNPQMPTDIATFCRDTPAELRTPFAAALDLICTQQRLINLALFDVCAWNGEPGMHTKKRKILAMTALADTASSDFYMLSAYALTTQSTPSQHWDIYRQELLDPVGYDRTFVRIRNSSTANVEDLDADHLRYSALLANSAATVGFRADFRHWQVSPVLTVVFDHAYADYVILKQHALLRLMVNLGDGRTRIVGVDEKLVEDGGQHDLAYTNLLDVLNQRMTVDHENSVRD